jgi:hypothetical protein
MGPAGPTGKSGGAIQYWFDSDLKSPGNPIDLQSIAFDFTEIVDVGGGSLYRSAVGATKLFVSYEPFGGIAGVESYLEAATNSTSDIKAYLNIGPANSGSLYFDTYAVTAAQRDDINRCYIFDITPVVAGGVPPASNAFDAWLPVVSDPTSGMGFLLDFHITPTGDAGADGSGQDGKTILSGTEFPTEEIGTVGDYFLFSDDTIPESPSRFLFGPKMETPLLVWSPDASRLGVPPSGSFPWPPEDNDYTYWVDLVGALRYEVMLDQIITPGDPLTYHWEPYPVELGAVDPVGDIFPVGTWYFNTATEQLFQRLDVGSWHPEVSLVGPAGPAGPTGAPGLPGDPGDPGVDGEDALWNFTGVYDVGASYAVGDIATYDGKTWYRLNSNGGNVGDTPDEGIFWTLLADTGAQGLPGDTGPTGPQGLGGTSASFGVFSHPSTQLNPVANTPNAMKFNTVEELDAVSSVTQTIVGGGTDSNALLFGIAGTYNVQFSAQLRYNGGGAAVVNIWFRKNGVDVPRSDTKVDIASSAEYVVAAWNLVLTVAATDTVQIMWASADTDVTLVANAATTTPDPIRPAIPSVILTATQVTFQGEKGDQGETGPEGPAAPVIPAWFYGSGADGAGTYGANTTLDRVYEFQDLTIGAGVVLNTGGYPLYVRGTLTMADGAKIVRDGNSASGLTAGAAIVAAVLGGSGAGGNGATSTDGVNGGSVTNSLGGAGGGFAGSYAGSPGTATRPIASAGGDSNASNLTTFTSGNVYAGATWNTKITGGGGGGGAGAQSGSGSTGGGGGSGGGVVTVFAFNIVAGVGAIISANGGNGANGTGTEAGGGSGGGGGFVAVVSQVDQPANLTLSATGGTGGTKVGTGLWLAGAPGSAGITKYHKWN